MFWIDQKKIDDQLRNAMPPLYSVAMGHVEPQVTSYVDIPSAEAHSTVNVLTPEAKAAHMRLQELRNKFIAHGGETASGDALHRIIDQIRGRR